MSKFFAVQKVGDRDKNEWSLKDIAFTLCSNAQSKEQKVIEIYENDREQEAGRGLPQGS